MKRWVALILREIDYGQRSYWRNPSSAFFTFIFPIVMLVIFASAFRDVRLKNFEWLGYPQYYVPGIVAFGIISACYTNLAIRVCVLRDNGVLKRIRGTPLPTWIFMAGQIGSCLIVSVALVMITTAVGVLFYEVTIPRHLPALVLTLTVGTFCFCALGLAVAVVVPYASAAPAIVNGLLFPLLFLSGMFFPLATGSTLTQIARMFPVLYFHQAVFTTFNPSLAGRVLDIQALLVMFAWGVAASVVAVCGFRWEPRSR